MGVAKQSLIMLKFLPKVTRNFCHYPEYPARGMIFSHNWSPGFFPECSTKFLIITLIKFQCVGGIPAYYGDKLFFILSITVFNGIGSRWCRDREKESSLLDSTK